MKLFQSIVIASLLVARLHALEPAEVAAVAKGFDNPSGDEQFKARMELNRLVAQATLPGKGDPAAVSKILISVLESAETSTEARKYIVRALTRLGTADAVDSLAKLLAGADPLLKEEARQALSTIRSPKAVGILEAALKKSSDKREKAGLMDALANLKSETSIPVIAPSILDSDADTATAALSAIARIGGAPAVVTLGKASASDKLAPALKPVAEKSLLIACNGDAKVAANIYQTTSSDSVRLAAFLVAVKGADASAKSAMVESALKSKDADLHRAALARGIELGLPSLQSSLAASMDQLPADDLMIVLANLHLLKPAETAAKLALGSIASPDEEVRIAAITALGKIGGKPAFDAVLKEVGAREPRVNQAASSALAGMAYPAAESTLLAMLKGDSNPDKVLAIKAMVSREVPGGNVLLIETIKGGDSDASKEAVKSLYFTATTDDLRSLCAAAAATDNAELRRSLVSICSRIATRIDTDEARELVKPLSE
jgi:HEAT repeat protein